MSSLGSWVHVHYPRNLRSFDPGLGIHAYPLTNVTSQILRAQLYEMADQTGDMPVPHELQTAPSVNTLPNTSPVVDRVHQQPKHDQPHTPPTTISQRDLNVTPPPRPIPSDGAQLDHGRRPARAATRGPAKRVYSIETLLKLRETQSAVHVMLRVKPEAIAGKPHMGSASMHRLMSRFISRTVLQKISSNTWERLHRVDFQLGPAVYLTCQTSRVRALIITIALLTHPLTRIPRTRLFVNQLHLQRLQHRSVMTVSFAF